MDYQFRPLERWPYPPTKNRRSKWTFRSSWTDTLNLLDRELHHLKARNVVFQVNCDRSHIRLDGMLRANSTVNHPGVILSFESQQTGSLSFPCDSCDLWQHNFRSIGLGLESLRSVDRYGITQRAEQYRGWDRLPSPDTAGPQVPKDLMEAIELVCNYSDLDATVTSDELLAAARKLLISSHPDRGGSGQLFRAINEAINLLTKDKH